MNRCTRAPSLRTRFAPTLLGLVATALVAFTMAPALAQTEFKPAVRQFPPGIKRATIAFGQPPEISVDGKAERLSPGARIRDTQNLLVFTGQLVGQSFVVNYLRENADGPVHQVWILNSEEAKIRLPGMKRSFFDFLSGDPEPGGAVPSQ